MSTFAGLVPELIPFAEHLLAVARYNGLNPVVTSVRRSRASQRRLYELRQRTLAGTLRPGERPQQYPVARPGTSDHELGLAFDMVVANPAAVGAYWKQMGGWWSPADSVHFFVR